MIETDGFSARVFSDSEGSALHVARLPSGDPARRILIGIACDWRPGAACFLDDDQAGGLVRALLSRSKWRHGALAVRPANRGEPYREGLEIALSCGPNPPGSSLEEVGFFLEDTNIRDALEILDGGPSL